MQVGIDDVAVVTGGASGIGLALARALGLRGARVAIADVRAEALEDAARQLRALGIEVMPVIVDVRDHGSVRHLADAVRDRLGPATVLCNNAGVVAPDAPMWRQQESAWDRAIDIKLRGVIHGVRAFVPDMIEAGRGHVLNTASSAGLAPLAGRAPYTASMYAVVGLTETLDLELHAVAPEVRASVLCPGLVDTPLGQNSAALGAIDLPAAMQGEEGAARLRAAFAGALTADAVAEAALAGIAAGRVRIAPGEGVLDRATARVDAMLADLRAALA